MLPLKVGTLAMERLEIRKQGRGYSGRDQPVGTPGSAQWGQRCYVAAHGILLPSKEVTAMSTIMQLS